MLKNFIGLRRLSICLSPAISAQFTLEMCAAAENCKKTLKFSIIQSSRSFSVIQGHQCWRHSKARH